MFTKLRRIWSGPRPVAVLRPRTERPTGSSEAPESVSSPVDLSSLPPVESRPEGERGSFLGDTPVHDVGEVDLQPPVPEPPEPFASYSQPATSAGRVLVQLLIVAVVAFLFGAGGGWLGSTTTSNRSAREAQASATKTEELHKKVEALHSKTAKKSEEARRQAEVLTTAAAEAASAASDAQKASAQAVTASRAAATQLTAVRQLATQVSGDAKRATDAAASTEKIANSLNIEEFRNILNADMAKFRAELQGNSASKENISLDQFRNEMAARLTRDRGFVTHIQRSLEPAMLNKGVEAAARYALWTKSERKQYQNELRPSERERKKK